MDLKTRLKKVLVAKIEKNAKKWFNMLGSKKFWTYLIKVYIYSKLNKLFIQ